MTDEVEDVRMRNDTCGEDAPRAKSPLIQRQIVDEQWVRLWDDAAAAFFYMHAVTNERVWQQPPVSVVVDREGDMGRGDADVIAMVQDTTMQQEDGIETGLAADWVEQFDPTSKRVYYYSASIGESKWDKPAGFVEGTQNETVDGVVRIQSVFRSKQARDRVRQMTEPGDAALSRPSTASATIAEISTARANSEPEHALGAVWRQHYDPRTQQHYYHNVETGEVTWTKPDVGALATSDTHGDSATMIQCAFRKKAAARSVQTKRQQVLDLTSTEVVEQKLRDLMCAVDEIHTEVDARHRSLEHAVVGSHSTVLTSPQASLRDTVTIWRAAVTRIRDRVLDHHHHGQLVAQLDNGPDKTAKALDFHDALAATRSECIGILRSICLSNATFVDIDVARINVAFTCYERMKQDELFAISDSRTLKVIHGSELVDWCGETERLLRRAMGLTDFTTGVATSMGKVYDKWRDDVQAAVDSVATLGQRIEQKRSLFAIYQRTLAEKREVVAMEHEDALATKKELAARRKQAEQRSHELFLERCRQCWHKGLDKRARDASLGLEHERDAHDKRVNEKDILEKGLQLERERRTKAKLSIWEAVRDGRSVEIIRTMVYAEMHKARQNGFDFVVRSAHSDRGESLVQIACWNGHDQLVEFFLDEGADLHAVESFCNRFTLLHDAARRGHSQIVRILLERGLRHDVVDRAGDTPLHWAVRKNHYEAIHSLLGAHLHRPDPRHTESALRAVRTKNHRGRTPLQVAKSECVKRLLVAFEEGRIPVKRCTVGSGSPQSSGHQANRRMTEAVPSATGKMTRTGSFRSGGGQKATLAKANTTKAWTSKADDRNSSPGHHHDHEEDEFGLITVRSR